MVSRCGSRGGGRIDRRCGGRDRRDKRIEIQQRHRNRRREAGADRAFGPVTVLVVFAARRIVMVPGVMCVSTTGIEELDEFGLRARRTENERPVLTNRGRHVTERGHRATGKSRPRQPGGDSANSLLQPVHMIRSSLSVELTCERRGQTISASYNLMQIRGLGGRFRSKDERKLAVPAGQFESRILRVARIMSV